MINTYADVIAYLEKHIHARYYKKITVGSNDQYDPLARMRHFLNLLGNPQKSFLSVVVSGTSGKGSTSYFIAHILATAGLRVGLTQSPHLQVLNERMQINQKGRLTPISDESLVALMQTVMATVESMYDSQYGPPTYFEILIGMTMVYFKQQEVQLAVIEVGLEGKFDATNAIDPALFILTNISFDHTAILGDSIPKIADEATYRIKSLKTIAHQPVVITAAVQPSVKRIIRRRSHKSGSKVLEYSADFGNLNIKHDQNGAYFDFFDRESQINLLKLYTNLRGRYQTINASLAIETIIQLQKHDIHVDQANIRQALAKAFFPGRYEITQYGHATCILDGAHNSAKMLAFLSSLKTDYQDSRKIFLIAFKKDKNIADMLRQIDQEAHIIIITQFAAATDMGTNEGEGTNQIHSQALMAGLSPAKLLVEPDCVKALHLALAKAEAALNGALITTGSLYLVGQVRDVLMAPTQKAQAPSD